jgi:hypothetical protein
MSGTAAQQNESTLTMMLREMDTRYQQRFNASEKALELTTQTTNELMKVKESAVFASIESVRNSLTVAMANADRAVMKAEASAEKCFDSVNEFRATLADQQRMLMPRSEVEVLLRAVNEKIDGMTLSLREQKGQTKGAASGWGYAVGVVGLVMTILSAFMHVAK